MWNPTRFLGARRELACILNNTRHALPQKSRRRQALASGSEWVQGWAREKSRGQANNFGGARVTAGVPDQFPVVGTRTVALALETFSNWSYTRTVMVCSPAATFGN